MVLQDTGVTRTSPYREVSWWGLEFLRDRKLICPQLGHSIFSQQCLIESSCISLKSVSLPMGFISSSVSGKPRHVHATAFQTLETSCLPPLPPLTSHHLQAQDSERPPAGLKLRTPGQNPILQGTLASTPSPTQVPQPLLMQAIFGNYVGLLTFTDLTANQYPQVSLT